jgi:hypothetical protein
MIPPWSVSGWAAIELVGDHLWQSTLCLAGAACLAWVLRHNRARVRHGVWLVASAKFLVPFAALVAMGGQLGWMLPANTMATPTRFVVEVVDAVRSLRTSGTNGWYFVKSAVVGASAVVGMAASFANTSS